MDIFVIGFPPNFLFFFSFCWSLMLLVILANKNSASCLIYYFSVNKCID